MYSITFTSLYTEFPSMLEVCEAYKRLIAAVDPDRRFMIVVRRPNGYEVDMPTFIRDMAEMLGVPQ